MRLLAILWLLLIAAPVAAGPLVFAAASLKRPLDEIARVWAEWEDAVGAGDVVLSYGGSGAMAQQILQGAPAEIFLSANPEWMDALAERGVLIDDTRIDLLGNALVLIGPAGAAPVDLGRDLIDRLGDGRLAVGQTASVPAGIYARAALTHLGLWDALAPRLLEAENVTAAARLVALGEAPLGVVYLTDTVGSDGIVVVAPFPPDSHPAIVYPAAALQGASPEALAFLDFLRSAEAMEIFASYGFTTPAP